MGSSPTLEKAILLLSEAQSSNIFFGKIAIIMLSIEALMLLFALYIVWKVYEDTTYTRRKLDQSGD